MNFFRIRLFKVSSQIKKSAIWRSYHKVFLKNCSKEFNYYPYKKHYWIIFPSFSSLLMLSLNPVSSWESTHFECGLALCHKSHVSLTNEAKSFLFVTFTLRHGIHFFLEFKIFPFMYTIFSEDQSLKIILYIGRLLAWNGETCSIDTVIISRDISSKCSSHNEQKKTKIFTIFVSTKYHIKLKG